MKVIGNGRWHIECIHVMVGVISQCDTSSLLTEDCFVDGELLMSAHHWWDIKSVLWREPNALLYLY